MPRIIAADNLQPLNPVVAQAINTLNPQPLQELARRCEQAGAQLNDINPGYLSPRHHDRMAFMVEVVRLLSGGEVWQAPGRTMVGLSNLRSGLRHTYPGRVEEAGLALLAGAGLEMALVDVLQTGLMKTVRIITQMV
jgi:hypothetical protein